MDFKISLNRVDLQAYVKSHLVTFFPDNEKLVNSQLKILVNNSLDRIEYCFSHIHNKYYAYNNEIIFDHLYSDHYCSFIYLMSNEAYKNGYNSLYNKLSVLNRYLHGIDLFGHVEMPKIFMLVHPIGTIIGRATLSDYLIIYQGVTIGGTHTEEGIKYPTFGEGVSLYARSMVLGDCTIGDNVNFAANSFIINTSVPHNKTVLGIYPDVRTIENKNSNIKLF